MDEEEENEHPAAHWRGADAGRNHAVGIFRGALSFGCDQHRLLPGAGSLGRNAAGGRVQFVSAMDGAGG